MPQDVEVRHRSLDFVRIVKCSVHPLYVQDENYSIKYFRLRFTCKLSDDELPGA